MNEKDTTSPKAAIHKEWQEVKAKRQKLETQLWGGLYRPVYERAIAKEWREALAREKELMELLRKKD